MNVRAKLSRIALLAALAVLALPAAALGEYYVPPGNSAANQYTETLPGAGGDRAGKNKGVTPAQALGAKNAKKLESKGPAGKAAAELAAETTPVVVDDTSDEESGAAVTGGGNGDGGQGTPNNAGQGDKGNTASQGEPTAKPVPTVQTTAIPVSDSSGSSGLSSVLGQATGVSDEGSLGLWLPLIILATIAGTVVYRLRLRHGPTA